MNEARSAQSKQELSENGNILKISGVPYPTPGAVGAVNRAVGVHQQGRDPGAPRKGGFYSSPNWEARNKMPSLPSGASQPLAQPEMMGGVGGDK